ncbi:unnamed protein product, partial [Adineta steineri]
MRKENDTEVQTKTSPIDTEILQTTNYFTFTKPCQEVPSQRLVTSPLPTGIGMDFPPPPPT